MKKNNKKDNFELMLEQIYFFLKDRFGFDDIQAVVFIISILVLPLSAYLGFSSTNTILIRIFVITLSISILTIIYSIIKHRYFNNIKLNFIKEFENKIELKIQIVVSNIQDINNLNPYEFEKFAKEFFKIKGYTAWITKASHDNGADVIAEKDNVRIAIQVKHKQKSLVVYDVYQVVRAMHSYKAEKGILFTNSELTSSAILDAQRNNFQVINGHDISKYLRNSRPIIVTNDWLFFGLLSKKLDIIIIKIPNKH